MRRLRSTLLLALSLCALGPVWPVPLPLLVTGDMHGWLQSQPVGQQQLGGAAEMMAYWRQTEGYVPGKFLVLADGDFNTGPVLATALKGDPMVDVMNLMGYNACVLGNHEFDYGIDRIAHWQAQAKFALLCANISNLDGTPSTLVPPYTILDEQGVKVGIVGLMTKDLPWLTNNAATLKVLPYAETLRRVVPEMRKQGAQVIIVLSHIPAAELIKLANQVPELGIPLMLGGHSHELDQRKEGNTWVVNSGEHWDAYSRLDMDFDPATGKTVVLRAAQVWLQQTKPAADADIAQAITRWQKVLGAEFDQVLGYTATGLPLRDPLFNFVEDCTLAMDPASDIALTNDGSLRQDIPAGAISKGTIVGVMPFSDSIYRVALTGQQLLDYLPGGFIGMAGLHRVAGKYLLLKTGQPLDPAATYHVLLSNYMYDVSPVLKAADPKPVTVWADWRQPVDDWLAKHPSSKDAPIEGLLDSKPRD